MGTISRFLTPNVQATFAVLFTAFLGAFFGYLQTQLEQGIPPENQWKHIVSAGLLVGAIAAYHRWKPDPATVTAAANRVVMVLAFACALLVAACAAFGGVVAPTVSVGQCLIQVGTAQSYPDFAGYFAAAWKACASLVEQDAVALLNAIVQSADPTVAQYAAQAKVHLGDAKARAELVAYAKANAGQK